MNEEYLKITRTNSLGRSNTSEAELITYREEFASAFDEMNNLRKQIIEEKKQALIAIDEKFKDSVMRLESEYAMMLTLAR